jgi:hypothetical protein
MKSFNSGGAFSRITFVLSLSCTWRERERERRTEKLAGEAQRQVF